MSLSILRLMCPDCLHGIVCAAAAADCCITRVKAWSNVEQRWGLPDIQSMSRVWNGHCSMENRSAIPERDDQTVSVQALSANRLLLSEDASWSRRVGAARIGTVTKQEKARMAH